ncbi:MAG: acyltransferase [Candidatus Electrothrix sp. EH2]|nr:acyltransferase [Candidatus Electrothrix sp. EH2]
MNKKYLLVLLNPKKIINALLWRLTGPVPWGLAVVNLFFQKVLRLNHDQPFPIHFTSRVWGDIKVGNNTWKSFAVSGGCYIQGGNGIEIGDDTLFAPGVKIISSNHQKNDHDKWEKAPPITIGRRVWIGANAVILPGVQIGDDAVIGAGAVVTKSVPQYGLAVGNPAKVIKILTPRCVHSVNLNALVKSQSGFCGLQTQQKPRYDQSSADCTIV